MHPFCQAKWIACENIKKDEDCFLIDFKFVVKAKSKWEHEDYYREIIRPFLKLEKEKGD